MAALNAGSVTYTLGRQRKEESGHRVNVVTLAFGDGALTYPAGGVPLTAAKLGTPNEIVSLVFLDAANANGFLYKWDKANNKLRIYQGDNTNAAAAPAVELATSATPAAASLVCQVVGW